jgi:hypothetical protein
MAPIMPMPNPKTADVRATLTSAFCRRVGLDSFLMAPRNLQKRKRAWHKSARACTSVVTHIHNTHLQQQQRNNPIRSNQYSHESGINVNECIPKSRPGKGQDKTNIWNDQGCRGNDRQHANSQSVHELVVTLQLVVDL